MLEPDTSFERLIYSINNWVYSKLQSKIGTKICDQSQSNSHYVYYCYEVEMAQIHVFLGSCFQ